MYIYVCMYICRQTSTVISKKEITNSSIMFLTLEVCVKAKIVNIVLQMKRK